MWNALPLELQNVIIALIYSPDASNYLEPRLMSHVPSKQFLLADGCLELRRRLGCVARGRALAKDVASRKMIHAFVEGVTRIAIDITRLRVALPSCLALSIGTKLRLLVTVPGNSLLMWAALGYSPSEFHCSVAAKAILDAKLKREEQTRVIRLLHIMFCHLHSVPVKVRHRQAEYLEVGVVLGARICRGR